MNLSPTQQQQIALYRQRLDESCQPKQRSPLKTLLKSAAIQAQLKCCWIGSQFAAEQCIAHPDWLLDLASNHLLATSLTLSDYADGLKKVLRRVKDEEALHRALRQFRNQSLLRIVWRDFNRLANTQQTIVELSYLAEVCIQQALDFLHRQLRRVHGCPRNQQGDEQRLLVLAMGKLGAYELNLSSDVDLIFVYPEEGDTDKPSNTISNHEFFIKLGQKLIRALDQHTVDGFVFRVDMALRPHGESGPLACSFDMLESYYQEQGRSWERYAMIKARVIAGDPVPAEQLMSLLRPFTYRRYIDFSVIESLRDMKALINREVKRKGYEDNIKLGSGGIREIEFIVQAFQLIRGGRDPDFQQRELLIILPLLAKKNLLPQHAVDELTNAYLFLRNTEHALQGFQDKQTQQLPTSIEDRERIAYVMGYADWPSFYSALQQHRQHVIGQFTLIAVFEETGETTAHRNRSTLDWAITIWESPDEAEKRSLLSAKLLGNQCSIEKLAEVAASLHELRQSVVVAALQSESCLRLDNFIPRLLQESLGTPLPCETVLHVLPFVYAVLRRSAYLVLLNENSQALKQLVLLSAASPWIAAEIAAHPVLLDELLDERTLYALPDREKLASALRQDVLRIPLDDLEAQMEALRYFKQAHRLRIAACEITGRLPLMKVSDALTFLAEVILNQALSVAWHVMTARYGFPTNERGQPCELSFIIIGYGKLGGLELGHNSDLDVVFVHGADAEGETNGRSPIDNNTFYMRLAQRIIHILETRTHSGPLYEIDTELRPSGNSGLLVSSWEAFDTYQRESAWTWEHQALVRARVVAGCPKLSLQFDTLRRDVLSRQRDLLLLRKDVVEMRERMVKHQSSRTDSTFDLKQDRGGIIDIEFMVQYAVLAWSHAHPHLLRWTDNIRILEELAAAELLPSADTQQLIETYKALRCAAHRLALQQQGSKVSADEFPQERKLVTRLWDSLLG